MKKSLAHFNKDGLIYILSIKNEKNIYKLGATTRNIKKRIQGYAKNLIDKIIITHNTNDCFEHESILKNIFKEKFKQRRDYGIEYYEGEVNDMINIIKEYFKDNNTKLIQEDYDFLNKNISPINDFKGFQYNDYDEFNNIFNSFICIDNLDINSFIALADILFSNLYINNITFFERNIITLKNKKTYYYTNSKWIFDENNTFIIDEYIKKVFLRLINIYNDMVENNNIRENKLRYIHMSETIGNPITTKNILEKIKIKSYIDIITINKIKYGSYDEIKNNINVSNNNLENFEDSNNLDKELFSNYQYNNFNNNQDDDKFEDISNEDYNESIIEFDKLFYNYLLSK